MACPRFPLAFGALAVASAAALTQPSPPPPPATVKIAVSPVAPPVPALRYQLLPDVPDLRPGNAVQGYYWCFSPEYSRFRDQEHRDRIAKWLEIPLEELPADAVASYRNVLAGVDRAARSETCDWNLADRIRSEKALMLLPDLQGMRELGWWVAVRCRVELKEGRFAAAAESLKTLFALARHVDGHPTLIGNLVGNAIAGVAADRVEEFVARPGAPSLYWALANLPSPLLAGRKGVGFERQLLRLDVGPEADEATPWDADKQARILDGFLDVLGYDVPGLVEGVRAKARARWAAWVADPAQAEFARKRLAAAVPAAALDRLPPAQVVLLDVARELDAARDELLKWAGVPYRQSAGEVRAAEARFEGWVGRLPDKGLWLGKGLGVGVGRMRAARARTEQRLAALRVVEGVRLHAAGHGGELPADLAAVPVPLPADPATGRAFEYASTRGAAEVRFSAPAKDTGEAAGERVVITLTVRR